MTKVVSDSSENCRSHTCLGGKKELVLVVVDAFPVAVHVVEVAP